MAVPTNDFSAIPASDTQAGIPGKQETFERIRGNQLRAYEILLAPGVANDDVAIQAGHRHLGKTKDGTSPIAGEPQANLVAFGDLVTWSSTGTSGAGNLAFDFLLIKPHRIIRATGSSLHKPRVFQPFFANNILRKIKPSGGAGVFTVSMHIKRVAAAAGVVGGSIRFGLHDSTNFITGAHIDIDLDDVTQEFQRFFFTTDSIARPSAFAVRSEFQTQPSDFDTISNGDLIAYHGGYMATRGAALAKWDIVHTDTIGDGFNSDSDDINYWWDEIITTNEITTIL